jgi:hypothetical protein
MDQAFAHGRQCWGMQRPQQRKWRPRTSPSPRLSPKNPQYSARPRLGVKASYLHRRSCPDIMHKPIQRANDASAAAATAKLCRSPPLRPTGHTELGTTFLHAPHCHALEPMSADAVSLTNAATKARCRWARVPDNTLLAKTWHRPSIGQTWRTPACAAGATPATHRRAKAKCNWLSPSRPTSEHRRRARP